MCVKYIDAIRWRENSLVEKLIGETLTELQPIQFSRIKLHDRSKAIRLFIIKFSGEESFPLCQLSHLKFPIKSNTVEFENP